MLRHLKNSGYQLQWNLGWQAAINPSRAVFRKGEFNKQRKGVSWEDKGNAVIGGETTRACLLNLSPAKHSRRKISVWENIAVKATR